MLQIATPKPSLAGHVEMALVNKQGVVKFHSKFSNLILDRALDGSMPLSRDFLARGGSGAVHTIVVGADVQTPPLPEDTTLNNQIDSEPVSASLQPDFILGSGPGEDYLSRSVTVSFGEGRAVGNLTEVGVQAAGTSGIVAKTLIKDSNGNPIAVEKTQDDVLFISYELRLYRPPMNLSEPFSLAGRSYRFYTSTLLPNDVEHSDVQGIPYDQWPIDDWRGDFRHDEMRNAQPHNLLRLVGQNELDSDGRVTAAPISSVFTTATIPPFHVSSDVSLEDRYAGPLLHCCHPAVGRDGPLRLLTTGLSMSNYAFGDTEANLFSQRATSLTSNNSVANRPRGLVVGAFLDSETLTLKEVYVPAQHRLTLTVDIGADSVTRR